MKMREPTGDADAYSALRTIAAIAAMNISHDISNSSSEASIFVLILYRKILDNARIMMYDNRTNIDVVRLYGDLSFKLIRAAIKTHFHYRNIDVKCPAHIHSRIEIVFVFGGVLILRNVKPS